jgi:DNA-binding HxlR family transcriptional regulator
MKDAAKHVPQLCTRFHYASELVGRRWNGAIIFMLLKQTCRFATLRNSIPGITDRMLSERLQELEEEGLVDRVVVPETPVRVEYSLTKKGKGLAEAVDSLATWAEKHISLEAPARKPARKSARSSKSAVR